MILSYISLCFSFSCPPPPPKKNESTQASEGRTYISLVAADGVASAEKKNSYAAAIIMMAIASEGRLQAALGILERLVKENIPRETPRAPVQRKDSDQDKHGKAKDWGEYRDDDEAATAAQARVEERITAACQLREGAMESDEGAKWIIKAGGVWTLLNALSYVESREEKGIIAAALANTLTYEGSERDDDIWPREHQAVFAKTIVVERATEALVEEIKDGAASEDKRERKKYKNFCENAVAAIAALCYDARAVPAVKRAGAIPILVECARGDKEREHTDRNVLNEGFSRKAALVALGNMAAEDTQAEKWLDKVAVEMLKQVLEECKSEEKAANLEKEALQLTNCIATNKKLHYLFRKMMGVDALLDLLEGRDESDERVVLILMALTGFACDEVVRHKLLGCDGVLNLAVGMLKSGMTSIQEVAIALFANLSAADTFGSTVIKVIGAEIHATLRSVAENKEFSSFGRAATSIVLNNLPTSIEKGSSEEGASAAQLELNNRAADREDDARLETTGNETRPINLELVSPRSIDSALNQKPKAVGGRGGGLLDKYKFSYKESDIAAGNKGIKHFLIREH